MQWIEQTEQGVIIRVQIQTKASRNQIVGLHGEPPRLKIRIAAPPIDGRANDELVQFLRRELQTSASNIQIQRGETTKFKEVLCVGMRLNDVQTSLLGAT